jgi:hypothetical protein
MSEGLGQMIILASSSLAQSVIATDFLENMVILKKSISKCQPTPSFAAALKIRSHSLK